MARHFTAGLAAYEVTHVTRTRMLPAEGEIVVEVGQEVDATTVVAKAELPGELHVVRLPERMGLQVFEVLAGLRVAEGQVVEKGELLCEHSGVFGLLTTKSVAPEAGVIEFIAEETGHIGLRLPSYPIELTAYLAGTVTGVDKGKSVTIEADSAFIQGIFGVGGERVGELHCLEIDGAQKLLEQHLPSDCTNLVIVGGTCPSAEVLQCLAERGGVGLIIGAIDDTALAAYLGYDLGVALTGDENVPFTLIVTEGFGSMGISERVLSLLKKLHGNAVSINGATQVRAGALRPEVLIRRDGGVEVDLLSSTAHGLEEGAKVRVIRVPYFGDQGVVSALPLDPQLIETGAYARVVEVLLDDGKKVLVPRANVELL